MHRFIVLFALAALTQGCDSVDQDAMYLAVFDESARDPYLERRADDTLWLAVGGRVDIPHAAYVTVTPSSDEDQTTVYGRLSSLTPERVRIEGTEVVGIAAGEGRVRFVSDDVDMDITVQVVRPTIHTIDPLSAGVSHDGHDYAPRDPVFLASQPLWLGHSLFGAADKPLGGVIDGFALRVDPADVVELGLPPEPWMTPRLGARVAEMRVLGTGAFRVESRFTDASFDGHIITLQDVDGVQIRNREVYLMYGDQSVFAFDYPSVLDLVTPCEDGVPGMPEEEYAIAVSGAGWIRADVQAVEGWELTAILSDGSGFSQRLPVQIVPE